MSLETASYIANLVVSNPDGGDARSTADDHIRLIKAVSVRTFPKMDSACSISSAQVMYLNDLSASVQVQFNALRDGSHTAVSSLYANSASVAGNALQLGGVSFSDFARLSQANTFLVNGGVSNTAPEWGLTETDANANYKRWQMSVNNEVFYLSTVLDSGVVGANFLAVARSAGVVTALNLTADTINLAGTVIGTISNATTAVTATTATTAVTATTATTATLANTATSASSAATLAGLAPDTTAAANTVAIRTAQGHLFAVNINQSSGLDDVSVGHVACMTNLDGYWRVNSLANLGSYLSARNITGKTGTAKTLAAGVGPPSLVGSTNGDVFYFY